MDDQLILWIKVSGQRWGAGEGGWNVDSVEDAVNHIIKRASADNYVYYLEKNGDVFMSSRKLKNLVRRSYGGKFHKEHVY